MARFRTDGLDELIADMDAMGQSTGDLADDMLMAGAEEIKVAWKKSALMHGHRDTGDMIASIGYPRGPKRIGDIKAIDIYPVGRDRKGVREAEKAFILHYGTTKIKGSHWVDDADDMAAPLVEKRLYEIYGAWLARHGIG